MPAPNPTTCLRNYLEKTLEEWADTIKDAVLDWDPVNERAGHSFGDALPQIPPAQLVEAVRDEMEVMLQRVVQVVNESPLGAIDPSAVRAVQTCFAALVNRAVVRGLQMRLDAAEATPHAPSPDPRSEWAKRYRSMITTAPHPGPGSPAAID